MLHSLSVFLYGVFTTAVLFNRQDMAITHGQKQLGHQSTSQLSALARLPGARALDLFQAILSHSRVGMTKHIYF